MHIELGYSLVPRQFFCHTGKNGLLNGLFHSRSSRQNFGGPIRLCYISDVIRGNYGDQEN